MNLLTQRERDIILRREWPLTPLTVDHMFLPVLVELEHTGAPFDPTGLPELSESLREEAEQAYAAVASLAGHDLNLNASGQKSTLLFEELELPCVKRSRKTGKCSADASVLSELDTPITNLILQYNAAVKLRQFVTKLPLVAEHFGGRIFYTINNTSIETGRLSTGGRKMGKWSVNVQQIPSRTEMGKLVRSHFVASQGRVLYAVDASQFQLRIAAVDSNDPAFIDSFKHGVDTYNATAIAMFGETDTDLRRTIKTVVLGTLFGAEEPKVLDTITKTLGPERARDPRIQGAYRAFFETHQTLAHRIQDVRDFVRRHSYGEDYFGRRNLYPLKGLTKSQVNKVLREAYNFYVQGPEATIAKLFLVMLWRGIRRSGRVAQAIIPVHDEGVFDVAPDDYDEHGLRARWFEALIQEVEDELNELLQWPVKIILDAGHGKTWADAH